MPVVAVPSGQVEYLVDGDGPPVVLLHGLLMDQSLWDRVMPLLPSGFRYIRPLLPFGSHRLPMHADADLSMTGMAGLVADFLEALDLDDVTLVHTDWGGGLFLTAMGRDDRVAQLVILPCEAFENFPPGLPGRLVALAGRIPGGLVIGIRPLRVSWLRRLPVLYGQMASSPLPDALMRRWTDPVLRDKLIRRDVRSYLRTRFDAADLVRQTEALAGFGGRALVLWSANKVMPLDHGRRLAGLIPGAQYREVPDAAVLSMLDQPEIVAEEMSRFLSAIPTSSS